MGTRATLQRPNAAKHCLDSDAASTGGSALLKAAQEPLQAGGCSYSIILMQKTTAPQWPSSLLATCSPCLSNDQSFLPRLGQ